MSRDDGAWMKKEKGTKDCGEREEHSLAFTMDAWIIIVFLLQSPLQLNRSDTITLDDPTEVPNRTMSPGPAISTGHFHRHVPVVPTNHPLHIAPKQRSRSPPSHRLILFSSRVVSLPETLTGLRKPQGSYLLNCCHPLHQLNFSSLIFHLVGFAFLSCDQSNQRAYLTLCAVRTLYC